MKKNKMNASITKRLRALTLALESKTLETLEENFYKKSILPALETLIKGELSFFSVIALGDVVTIQDWINSYGSESELFEASGRLAAMADMLRRQAMQEAGEEQAYDECNECDECKHTAKERLN